MITSRRNLPPTSWLSAFEATARLGSVTFAAAELDLTQGAVSRQIIKLEELLGVKLFLRERQRLVITQAGQAYAGDIRGGLNLIGNAGIKLRTNPDGGTLELAILPAFGTHWLAPRLSEFLAANAGVTINLSTRMRPFDFETERFHAAIHFGNDNWPETKSIKILEEDLVAVVAPSQIEMVGGAEMIREFPLLQLASRTNAWATWFAELGLDDARQPRMTFDQFAPMLQAALFGAGAALLPKFLVQPEIAAGRLVEISPGVTTNVGSYFLVWSEKHDGYPPLVAFRSWVTHKI